MNTSPLIIGLVLAAVRVAAAEQESTPGKFSFAEPSPARMTEVQVRQFNESLDTAAPGEAFFEHLVFTESLSLGELRQLSQTSYVPRLVAMVEFQSLTVPGEMVRMPFVLGLYYDTDDAWNHQVCRASMYQGVADTSNAQATEWPVREIYVIADTDAARTLRSAITEYPATLIRAHKQGRLDANAMQDGAVRELAEFSSMCAKIAP